MVRCSGKAAGTAVAFAAMGLFGLMAAARAQAPEGPMAARPVQAVQQPAPGQDGQGRLRFRVELVNTPVTVRDGKGEMMNQLEASDFRVTDNGVEQKITHFDLGGDPLSVVFLIETSSRVEPMLPEIRKAGVLFTQTVMGPDGEGAVVGFNDSVDKLQDFTSNGDAIENTVSHLEAGTSGSKLFDAMAVGVEMLTGRPQPTADKPGRRRLLLILSEAQDIGSEMKLGAVLRQAQLANVTIYSVGISTTAAGLRSKKQYTAPEIAPPGINTLPPMPGTIQTPQTEAARAGGGIDLLGLAIWAVKHAENTIKDHPLEIATTATGGAHFPTFKDQSIEKAIDEIGGELHSQYVLSYAPTGTEAFGYHEIKVSLVAPKEKNLKIRARPGYYVEAPTS